MRKFAVWAAALLLLLSVSLPAFSQGSSQQLPEPSATVPARLIPGVTIKATAVDTGVVSTTVTNEAGAYNFAICFQASTRSARHCPGSRRRT